MAVPARFALLGSGNSTGVPWLQCIMNATERCSVCASCVDDPASRNRRNNVSALLSLPDSDTHIMIDCGKTFRDTALKRFPALGVKKLAAVIITHPHADAFLGLDDLRDASPHSALPIYCSQDTFLRAQAAFPHLMTAPRDPGLFVARLEWNIIREWEPFEVAATGVICTPIPVIHGTSTCFGFEFQALSSHTHSAGVRERAGEDEGRSQAEAGRAGDRIVYISDIQALPLDVRTYLTCPSRGPIHTLFLDALSYRHYPSHFCFRQAVACALDLQPARTVLVGMNHRIDYAVEHNKLQSFGRARGLDMGLGYDGWCMDLMLGQGHGVHAARQAILHALPSLAARVLYEEQLEVAEEEGRGPSPLASVVSLQGGGITPMVGGASVGTGDLTISLSESFFDSLGPSGVHSGSASDGAAPCHSGGAGALPGPSPLVLPSPLNMPTMRALSGSSGAASDLAKGALTYAEAVLPEFEEAASPTAAAPAHMI